RPARSGRARGALRARRAPRQRALRRQRAVLGAVRHLLSQSHRDAGGPPAAHLRRGVRRSVSRIIEETALVRTAPTAGVCDSMAERVGFEPTCRFYPTIRFRVGAVMTASVPLRLRTGVKGLVF